MNTSSKRLSRTFSLITSYLVVLVVCVFISSFLTGTEKISCSPTIHSTTNSSIVFTPNLDIQNRMNYNVKEAYIYLVHKLEIDGVQTEQTVWSTLARTNNNTILKEKEFGISTDKRPLLEGVFILKGSYFPYIGIIKDEVFAEFSS